jgi:hypothetical protein
MKHLIIGVAAIALAAGGALAQGNGNGNGGGNGKAKAEQSQQARGNDNRGGGAVRVAAQADRGPAMRAGNSDRGGGQPADRGNGNANRGGGDDDRAKAARTNGNAGANRANLDRGNNNNSDNRGNAVRAVQADGRGNAPDWSDRESRRGGRVLDDGRRIFDTADRGSWWGDVDRRGLIEGCPPGLAKKNNGCVPPGLARKDDRYRFANYRPDWWGLSSLGLGDGRYFYEDGYLMRLNGDRVSGFIPLLGGALSIGNPWPSYYAPQPIPPYYADYYGLGPVNNYRYADNVLYRVDPESAAITSIAALLTGDDIRVGQPMPMGYDVYNVPYPYRSQYLDGPTANYRYSDGYVYQVDPETRLVAAAIELLAS